MAYIEPSRFQKQGPASNCVIHGRQLGWLSCTAYATAHGIDKSSFNAKRPSGCDVRSATGDVTGGLTLNQVAPIAEARGLEVSVRVGSNVVSPRVAAAQGQIARGFVLQGDAGALVNTRWQSTGGPVNHAIWINALRGGTSGHPAEARVYDSAADGRVTSWGTAAIGPSWWPWSRVLAFAAALHPWGDNDPRKLGPGKFYAMFFPQTTFRSQFGGVPTTPFPDRVRGKAGSSAVSRRFRHRPSTASPGIPNDILSVGELFIAYQTAHGSKLSGSDVWYGDQTGTRWVHSSGLAYKGGLTISGPTVHEALQFVRTLDEAPIEGAEDLPDDVRDGDIGQYE